MERVKFTRATFASFWTVVLFIEPLDAREPCAMLLQISADNGICGARVSKK